MEHNEMALNQSASQPQSEASETLVGKTLVGETSVEESGASLNRRGFLKSMAVVAGAGIALPHIAQAAPKTPIKPAAKPPVKPATGKATSEKLPNAKARGQNAASTKTPVKEQQLNVAFIGPGSQGRNLLLQALRIPGIRFQAVCDIWPYHARYAKNILSKYKMPVNVYEDYREMLAGEKDLDAVIIATPDWVHAPQTVACLEAGLHVYCEKEMSNTLEGARSMVEAQRRTGKLLQIGHQRRSNPRYWKSYELIQEQNALGRITHVYGQWNRSKRLDLGFPKGEEMSQAKLEQYGYETMDQFRNWRWYRQYSGGPMADLGSHQVDIFLWFLRTNPHAIMASGGLDYYKDREWYDNVMSIYEFEPKPGQIVRGYYQVINTCGYNGFFEAFLGDAGALEISENADRGFLAREPDAKPLGWENEADRVLTQGKDAIAIKVGETLNTSGRPSTEAISASTDKQPHQLHLENFFNAIRKNTKLSCHGEIGYETAVAVLKANEAVKEQRRLTFDKNEFRVA